MRPALSLIAGRAFDKPEPDHELQSVDQDPPGSEVRPAEALFILRGNDQFHWELVDRDGRCIARSAVSWDERRRAWVSIKGVQGRAVLREGFKVHVVTLETGEQRAWWELTSGHGRLAISDILDSPEQATESVTRFTALAVEAAIRDETLNGQPRPAASI